jgi:hypothetical protein
MIPQDDFAWVNNYDFFSFISFFFGRKKLKGFQDIQLIMRIFIQMHVLSIQMHELLLQKLDKYGFSLNALKMIENYLSNRNSIVNFNGSKSKSEILKCSVPQGSFLGPLLFIIFINDLCYILTRANKCLFADDTTLVISGKNIADPTLDPISALESDLKSISEWLKHNRLLLNVSK